MKRKVKSYLVFTSVFYKVMMFLLVPMLLVFYYYLAKDSIKEIGLIVVMVLFIMFEIIFDTWLFGGIQSKEAEKLDILKTSGRGMEVMRNALKMDLVGRFLLAAGILGICYLLEGAAWNNVQAVAIRIYLVLVAYTISTLGALIARYWGVIWTNVAISYVAALLGLLCWFLPGLKQYALLYDLAFVVLAVWVSILAVRIAMKKMEGSYYDK